MPTQPPVSLFNFKITYWIDGVDISSYKVFVRESQGLFDVPKRKIAYKHDWLDENGEDVDLATVKTETREIKLDCFVVGDTIIQAIENLNSLLAAIDQPGYRVLTVQYYNTNDKLTFNVYREEAVKVMKKFRYRKNVWSFTLSLKEYNIRSGE